LASCVTTHAHSLTAHNAQSPRRDLAWVATCMGSPPDKPATGSEWPTFGKTGVREGTQGLVPVVHVWGGTEFWREGGEPGSLVTSSAIPSPFAPPVAAASSFCCGLKRALVLPASADVCMLTLCRLPQRLPQFPTIPGSLVFPLDLYFHACAHTHRQHLPAPPDHQLHFAVYHRQQGHCDIAIASD